MANGGADSPAPPSENGGEFLLSLLHRRPSPSQGPEPHHHHRHQSFPLDPAIAAVGPTVNAFPPSSYPTNNGGSRIPPPWSLPFSSPPNRSPNLLGFSQFDGNQRLSPEDAYRLGFSGTGNHTIQQPERPKLLFGSFSGDPCQSLNSNHRNPPQSLDPTHQQRGGFSGGGNYGPIGNNNNRGLTKSSPPTRGWDRDLASLREHNLEIADRIRRLSIQNDNRFNLAQQIDHPGPPMGSTSLHSVSGVDAEDTYSLLKFEDHAHGGGELRESPQGRLRYPGVVESKGKKEEFDGIDDFGEDIVESLLLDDETEDKDAKDERTISRTSREKESRNDNRGQRLLYQRERMVKRYMACRNDIHRLDAPFIAVFKSLIPAEEEIEKQRQLMAQLENLVSKEWPRAKLYLYGSCANSFGFPKSDIDVCLAIEDDGVNKSEMLLKLADLLVSDNLQNVQALTRARVPIVKLMDPVTGISCDICINNVLAVVNTKLLRDYSRIDGRLRQLAFIVKHWAKSRKVNETYHGTLSSYAYVLMCIHFLQIRQPPILPCLQEMEPTYSVRVDNIRCEYFDNVERLVNFGSNNRETIAELVWGFFNYWAYAHDYSNNVISVRTGSIIGKREKDWTRRVGNDRHLICIEDPFETSHDLGRVVDKFSIRVLREEFERAAKIMQQDHNPCAKLFEPYLPPPGDNNGHYQQGHN